LADILIVYNIEGAASRGLLEAYPNLQEWLTRMRARPAFQAATKLDDRPSMILPSK
jgi:glutathione S-transferase